MADYLQNERRKPNGEALRKEGKKWLSRIEDSWSLEKVWHEDAEKAVTAYTGERSDSAYRRYDFNILFSNVETIVPAIINSPPQPDIRRRFADEDPAAKDVSELLERAIRIQVDDSRLQKELESTAHDAFLAGRGVIRLRFKADVGGEIDHDELKDLAEDAVGEDGSSREGASDGPLDGEPGGYGEEDRGNVRTEPGVLGGGADRSQPGQMVAQQSVRNERICFEAVSWRDYRHGPAKRWEDRPWEAFRHSIPMEDLEAFADKALTDAQTVPEDKAEQGETGNDVIVWEVWCRKSRKVKFVEDNTGKILKQVDDPLGLSWFFPTATPIQPIEVTGRLMPVNPFSIYRNLADELDTTTHRINVITQQMKVAGWYPGSAMDLERMVNAADTEFVPIADHEIWAQNGGIDGAVAFWPIERFVVALKELYVNRDQTKQAIYEITGIADIVRGASKASETLGAQQIKSQWGSLRIQKMQRLVERAARDLFVMMAEIIPDKFSAQTLQEMTGVQLIPSQQDLMPTMPQVSPEMPPEQRQQALAEAQKAEQQRLGKLQKLEAINSLLNSRVASYYRIDVESDSTVRADLTQKKAEQAEFLQGTAAFFQGVAPMIQAGALSQEAALEIYAATARLFTLGKSTEDALEREMQQAKERAGAPKPPSPEEVKAQMEMQKAQLDAQMQQAKAQSDQAKAQADIAKTNAAIEATRIESDLKISETNAKMQAESQSHALELQKGALELEKTRAEIVKIQVGSQATMMGAQAKQQAAREKPNGASTR